MSHVLPLDRWRVSVHERAMSLIDFRTVDKIIVVNGKPAAFVLHVLSISAMSYNALV